MSRAGVAALLDPRSVAVVGASNNPLKRGYQAIRRLLADGFPHPIYPVNPREVKVLGLPAYPRVGDVEGPVDLALLATPAAAAPGVLRECGQKGVAAAVVIAVGFGETGAQGRALEDELAGVAAEQGICLVGPNTNGVFNLPARLNLVGSVDVAEGPIALLCQSGNMALSIFAEIAHTTDLGLSAYVGIGNEAGLRYHDILDYLEDDPRTRVALVYAEGFRDGRRFLASSSRVGRAKPVVCYKAGRSAAAQRSALSHTGAVAGSHAVAAALLRQAGVAVVDRSDEMLAVTEALLGQPAMGGPSVAVLTDGGGHGTVAADALVRLGLGLPEPGPSTRKALSDELPSAASTRNPVDVAGATDRDPRVFEPCLEALLADPAVDGVLCVGLLGGYGIRFSDTLAAVEEQAARRMAELAATAGKPLVVQSAYSHARPPAHHTLRAAGVPVHASIEVAARCLAALCQRGRFLATAAQRTGFGRAARPALDRQVAQVLTEPEGRALLARHGVATGAWSVATDAEEAIAALDAANGPVALKIVSPDIVHKSDVGGVRLGLATPDEIRGAFTAVVEAACTLKPDARIDGVLVTPMAPAGVELIVGAVVDPSFGPVLTVGAGGTAVEVLGDTSFRAAPVTPLEAGEMLDELAIAPLLRGFRGAAPIDRAEVVALVQGVSNLMEAEPEIVELDLNPVVAHPGGLAVVDVRVVHAGAAAGGSRPGVDHAHQAGR